MIRTLLLASLVFGCSSSTPTAPTTPPPVHTQSEPSTPMQPDPEDRKTVIAETVYKGQCAPAGSRGGCHTLTLRPDGTFTEWMYDAGLDGTYTIQGTTVTLTGGDSATRTLEMSADGKKIGEFTLER